LIGKITGQYEIGSVAKSRAKNGFRPAEAGGGDEASFSAFAVELARVSGELKNVPDVRQDLIDDFKRKVEAGEYHPPLHKVAHHLLTAGILNVEE